ncbi:FxLYD domain-containing protein [Anaerotardibacter muris]|uniref:FxLYD domain-containing protein n=1 Tax=Anaerotardibacter muris TaxID=2941505 RepID=UPI00203EC516|nr:FxLYD domain-containing protein [Anaerotardibacter muris]
MSNDAKNKANNATTPATPDQKPPKSAAAITALVLSIVAIALSLLPIINNFAFLLAIVGLVFGIVGIVGIKGGKKSGMGMAVASVVIAAIALVAVLGSQAMYGAALDSASNSLDRMTGDATEEILGNDVEVAFGTYKLKKGSYGVIESELPVKVTNLTDERESYWIKIEATDEAGNRIEDDTVIVNDLGPGQSQTMKAFSLVTSDHYDAMKTAQFTIVSVSAY